MILALLAAAATTTHAAPTPADFDTAAKSARELLGKMVAADTTSPPGNEARAVKLGVARLKDADIPYEVTQFAPDRENLVARLKGTGPEKPILILSHLDVVGVGGQTWATPPHQMTEVGPYLFGRGVIDDLGMAAVTMEVFHLLKRHGVKLRRDVILAWTGDEESGGGGIQYLLKNHRASIDAAFALNEGGGPELNQRGEIRLISVQSAEKTYQDFTVTAKGPTGHSSVPMPGNAIVRLARALERIGTYQDPPRLLAVTREYYRERGKVENGRIGDAMRAAGAAQGKIPASALKALESDPTQAANLRTTCVVTTVAGGSRVNALPALATANVNCRVLPDEKLEDVQKRLARLAGADAVVTFSDDMSAAPASPTEGEVWTAIRKVSGQFWPGAPVIPYMSRGASDSRFLRAAGIPAYGISPIAAAEEDDRRAHGIDERIPTKSLRLGVEYFYRLIVELAGPASGT